MKGIFIAVSMASILCQGKIAAQVRAVVDARMQATMDVDLHCQDELDRAVVIDTPEARRLAFLNMRTGDNVQQNWIVEDLQP